MRVLVFTPGKTYRGGRGHEIKIHGRVGNKINFEFLPSKRNHTAEAGLHQDSMWEPPVERFSFYSQAFDGDTEIYI
jgi:hypothetical protein